MCEQQQKMRMWQRPDECLPETPQTLKIDFMWQGQNTWIHYVKNIIAADISSAIFLASFLRRSNMNKSYIAHLEAIDLQRYKVLTKKNKVRAALSEATNTPFIFFVGKN